MKFTRDLADVGLGLTTSLVVTKVNCLVIWPGECQARAVVVYHSFFLLIEMS